MRVTILPLDLSHNCLGRAHVLAQLAERNHEVEIVGPELGEGIWEPLQNEYDYKSVDMNTTLPRFLADAWELSEQVTGDIIYASKPRMSSYGVGLLTKTIRDIPLVLDIDDWELGFHYSDEPRFWTHLKRTPVILDVNSPNYTWLLEQLATLADERTVSNRFLKNKFGGTLIQHARDTDVFTPERFSTQQIRKELGLPENETLVMFCGTPRPHKGVDDLIEAVKLCETDGVRGVVVGAHDSEYVANLRELSAGETIFKGRQPFEDLPKWIAAADIITIPQKVSPSTRGQLPAKVFDAMAMAKPIVATNVSDLPEILDDCGVIVNPSAPGEMAKAIQRLADDPDSRAELGRRARQKCVSEYSYNALAPKLDAVIQNAV